MNLSLFLCSKPTQFENGSKRGIKNIGQDIIGAAFSVMRNSGRGMREIYYEKAMVYELRSMGYDVREQVAIPVYYRGEIIDDAYMADIIVNQKVILELKAVASMHEAECRQLITYLKLTGYKLGYLINFGASNFCVGRFDERLPYRHGIYRFVNNL